MSDSARILTWLADWLNGGGNLLVMTDYDGTLAPIVENPEDANLPRQVHDDLRTLACSPRTRLAVISGRDVRDLRKRIGVPEAIYAGCHGLEIEGRTLSYTHPDAAAEYDRIQAISDRLNERAASVPGMRVESKRLAVAVHYRQVADDELRRVEIELARAIRVEGSRLKLLRGAKVIEVLPQVAWTKGECALWIRDAILRESSGPLMVLYVGDDWTDENAFERLAGQALTVRVGTDVPVSRADYRLADVAEVHGLFSAMASDVAQRSAA